MNKEQEFAKTLEEMKTTAKKQGNVLEQSQIDTWLNPLALTDAQIQLVYGYLKENHIGIDVPLDEEEYLEKDEIDYLKMYTEELEALPKLTEGEKEAITLSAMAGDMDACAKLIEAFLPNVVELAKLYVGQGVFVEDLIGEGNVAIAAGVTMLGAAENAKDAEAMMVQMVMDAMEDYIAENGQVAENALKVLQKVNKVSEKAEELAKDLCREVTMEELAEETGMSLKYIKEAMKLSGNQIEYIETPKEEA